MAPRGGVLLFAAFSRCLQLIASQDCSVTVSPSPLTSDPSFCIREATVRRAKSLTVLSNGACRMIVDCTGDASAPCCPIFVRKHPPQLLLRTRVERDTNPYHLFESTTTNRSAIDANTKLTNSDPYMSPLISKTPTPLTHIRVQMLTGNVGSEPKLETELRFRIEENDFIPNGTWFSKSRLVGSSPWDINQMQSLTYTYFSIKGAASIRRFYLSQNNNGCSVTAGFMFTTDDVGHCSWEYYPVAGRPSEHGRYMWAVKNKRFGVWKTKSHDADEFRMVGESDNVHYVRM